eukprot:7542766-Lingulodinium_polyedra.AAC.1
MHERGNVACHNPQPNCISNRTLRLPCCAGGMDEDLPGEVSALTQPDATDIDEPKLDPPGLLDPPEAPEPPGVQGRKRRHRSNGKQNQVR